MSKRGMTIILSLLVAFLVCSAWLLQQGKDRKRPEISFTEEQITYTEGEDTSVLLANVTAYDEHDGDLTSEIRVNQIRPIQNNTKARVTYAVVDAQNNIATAYQVVDYIASPGEAEPGPEDTFSEEGEVQDTAADENALNPEGGGEVNPAAPVLALSTYTDTISVSDSFNYNAYIASITDDWDSQETLYSNIIIEGDYSSTRAGTYPLIIYVTDSDGNISNRETFILYRG